MDRSLKKWWWKAAIVIGFIGIARELSKQWGILDREKILNFFEEMTERMGIWTMPIYVAIHALTLALCLPYAFFFEAAAPVLFGFFNAVLCVFSAKVLGASLSFWIGRLVFRSSTSAMEWVQGSKYFSILSRGVERDGWKFVLLARFSPIPSYIINYALAATKVGFFVDFLLPTIIGCLPMILQNTSIGSLASVTVTAVATQKSQLRAYLFPMLGIGSSILISMRIKKYSNDMAAEFAASKNVHTRDANNTNSSQTAPQAVRQESRDVKKSQ